MHEGNKVEYLEIDIQGVAIIGLIKRSACRRLHGSYIIREKVKKLCTLRDSSAYLINAEHECSIKMLLKRSVINWTAYMKNNFIQINTAMNSMYKELADWNLSFSRAVYESFISQSKHLNIREWIQISGYLMFFRRPNCGKTR